MSHLQGQFLVASPHLGDGNFYRSVVLMIKHDDEGAFGLILNRPTGNTVREVWRMVTEEELDCDQPIYLGGPVQGPLVCLHRIKSCAEAEVLPGVYFAAHKDELHKIVSQTAKPFRLFTGYAGWAGGQLEGELQVGGWLTLAGRRRTWSSTTATTSGTRWSARSAHDILGPGHQDEARAGRSVAELGRVRSRASGSSSS